MKIHEERRHEKHSIHALSKVELSALEEDIRQTWKLAAIIWCRTGERKHLYTKADIFLDHLVDHYCIKDIMADLKSYLESFEEEYTLVPRDEEITD